MPRNSLDSGHQSAPRARTGAFGAVRSAENEPRLAEQLNPVLKALEAAGPDTTGALQIAGPHHGCLVFVESGRICWAAAPGLAPRLTELLRVVAEPPLTAAQMQQLYEACRRTGRPLGETLLHHGRISPAALSEALLRHTCEALLVLAGAPLRPAAWISRDGRGYDARFSFTPVQVLLALAALPAFGGEALSILARHVPAGRWGLAFGGSAEAPVLVAACGAVPPRFASLEALDAVGRWAVRRVPEPGALRTRGEAHLVREGGLWLLASAPGGVEDGCDER